MAELSRERLAEIEGKLGDDPFVAEDLRDLLNEVKRQRADLESDLRTLVHLCAEDRSLKRRITELRRDLQGIAERRSSAGGPTACSVEAAEMLAADTARRLRFEKKARGR